MKVQVCKSCGYLNTYINFQKKGHPPYCLFCYIVKKEKHEFEIIDINFEHEQIHCRLCGKLYLFQMVNPIPYFYCNIDKTFYCGCQDITSTLESNNISEFVEFINPNPN